MMDSVFTKIIKGESSGFRLWENEQFIAILDIHPINPGHTLLIPKQQIDSIFDLPNELYCSMLKFLNDDRLTQSLIRSQQDCYTTVQPN